MSWQPPTADEILETVDATWPAARYFDNGPFTLRMGQDGGQRVSAATANGPVSAAEIGAAESAMRAMHQPRLFMIRAQDAELNSALEARGYRVKDPVTFFAAPIDLLAQHSQPGQTAILVDEPMQVMKNIWATGGIEKGRLAVMARAKGPKTYLMGRVDDTAAGAGYVTMHGKSAMLHALEILPEFRRQGLGMAMTSAAAQWAKAQGASTFTLIAISSNPAACGLYSGLGMTEAGNYHYRIKE